MVVYRASVMVWVNERYITLARAFGTTPEGAWKNLERIYPVPVDMPEEGDAVESDEYVYSVEKVSLSDLKEEIDATMEYLGILWNVLSEEMDYLEFRGESE